MPRITAATVAEHRAAQRDALIRAGAQVLRESGIGGVTPRAVCERAGLSRSSFYDYFPARDDLLVAIAIRAIEEWDHEIEAALDAAGPGLPELRAFIHETMAMTASGRHDLAGTLRQAELSPHRYEELMRLHEAVVRPLRRVLSDLGVPEGHNGIWFVQGVLTAGIDLVSHGSDHHAVAEDVYRFVATGLGLVADPQS